MSARKIGILVVDDSIVVRHLLTKVLSEISEFEVKGAATNGRIALTKIPLLNPDIVLLDINMPEMDGLSALSEIRKIYPKLPVIMLSTLTKPNAEATLEALARGANDYATKPENTNDMVLALKQICFDLTPKIKAFCQQALQEPAKVAPPFLRPVTPSACPVSIVVIGISTGGPNALNELVLGLPQDFPVPIAIVQHMPPLFTKILAGRLMAVSKIPVWEAKEGDCIKPSQIWIAPGGYHMVLKGERSRATVSLNQEAPENSCRPSVDVLFRSAAAIYGPRVLAVMMTGMGEDGKLGCQEIVRQGGRVVAQDRESSVVWGMPGSVVQAGLAMQVLPLSQIALQLKVLCA